METILLEILNELRRTESLDAKFLAQSIHRYNRNISKSGQHCSKKKLFPYYRRIKETDPERWASWGIDEALEKRLLQVLQVKPRRTASGVATITVITKPWRCSSDCLYCPNDLRMPKSYLSDEPACQRAEMNYFDPYLQVVSRLHVLTQMGHLTDKIELIILGGTWSDYPASYQTWFVSELFRALNDGDDAEQNALERRRLYEGKGLSTGKEEAVEFVAQLQHEVNGGMLTYNQAWELLYRDNTAWKGIAAEQVCDFNELTMQQDRNEKACHRVVGLAIETRPDTVTADSLNLLRRLGCTKVQMGIQSLNPAILALNRRNISPERIQEAFELLRIFGFKIHTHFMVNLYGADAEEDKRDYERLVTEKAYLPDEVKLYPCVLVEGTKLCEHYADGSWRAYSENELLDILIADTLNTPPFMRISRMVRDISAHDIVAGNKKANLRQLVEDRIRMAGKTIAEIRYREISTDATDIEGLVFEMLTYETTVTQEYFLQWVNPEGRIAGFLRLSLPNNDSLLQRPSALPIGPDEAMIREVHIYGKVAALHRDGEGAQHLGLGRQLIEVACNIAKAQGYKKMNVISSVGTREYYRNLGFSDNGLYQQKTIHYGATRTTTKEATHQRQSRAVSS